MVRHSWNSREAVRNWHLFGRLTLEMVSGEDIGCACGLVVVRLAVRTGTQKYGAGVGRKMPRKSLLKGRGLTREVCVSLAPDVVLDELGLTGRDPLTSVPAPTPVLGKGSMAQTRASGARVPVGGCSNELRSGLLGALCPQGALQGRSTGHLQLIGLHQTPWR